MLNSLRDTVFILKCVVLSISIPTTPASPLTPGVHPTGTGAYSSFHENLIDFFPKQQEFSRKIYNLQFPNFVPFLSLISTKEIFEDIEGEIFTRDNRSPPPLDQETINTVNDYLRAKVSDGVANCAPYGQFVSLPGVGELSQCVSLSRCSSLMDTEDAPITRTIACGFDESLNQVMVCCPGMIIVTKEDFNFK